MNRYFIVTFADECGGDPRTVRCHDMAAVDDAVRQFQDQHDYALVAGYRNSKLISSERVELRNPCAR